MFRIIKSQEDWYKICYDWIKKYKDIEKFNVETFYDLYSDEIIIGNPDLCVKDFIPYFKVFGYGNVAVDWNEDGTDTLYFRICLTGDSSNCISNNNVREHTFLLNSDEFGVEMIQWQPDQIPLLTFRQWWD